MSWLGERVLGGLVRVWPNPQAARTRRFGAEPGTAEYNRAYTQEQFMYGVWFGSPLERDFPSLVGKRVLEVGCGHGGITCYLATLGAELAVGADLAVHHVRFGQELAGELSRERPLRVAYTGMDVARLGFKSESFDVVVADNLFEHVVDPAAVLSETHRVLKPGGQLVVPVFSSIHSKWGLHLKHGIKMPWANLVFDEGTIVEVLKSEAERRPQLKEIYPGLQQAPSTVRDVRRFKDLNNITHKEFRRLAREAGFEEKVFRVHGTRLGQLAVKVAPALKETPLLDVLSTGAGAVLRKPA